MAKNKVNINWAQDGVIELDSDPTIKKINTTGHFTPILQYKIPRGRVAMFSRNEKLNLYVPTSKTVTHSGGGSTDTFDLTYGIIDGNGLDDNDIIRVFKDADGTEIDPSNVIPDYANDQVDITHDTNEDLIIYYLASEGQVRITAVKPTGSGGNYKRLFNSSIRKIHSVNQIITTSDVQLERSWVAKEKHIIKLELKADYQVAWLSENADIDRDIIGQVWIPFRFNRIENFTDDELAKINAMYSF